MNGKYLTVVSDISLIEMRELKPAHEGMLLFSLFCHRESDHKRSLIFAAKEGMFCSSLITTETSLLVLFFFVVCCSASAVLHCTRLHLAIFSPCVECSV